MLCCNNYILHYEGTEKLLLMHSVDNTFTKQLSQIRVLTQALLSSSPVYRSAPYTQTAPQVGGGGSISLFTQNVSGLDRKSGNNKNIKRGILPIVTGVGDQVHLCWEVHFLFGTAVTAAKATENRQKKGL